MTLWTGTKYVVEMNRSQIIYLGHQIYAECQRLKFNKTCAGVESNPTPGDDTVISSSPNMHLEIGYELIYNTAFAHMLKDYLVFGFVPRLTFRNESKG